jgi:hypothetical protein
MLLQVQDAVPLQFPLPPRLFVQDTCAIPTLSDALPPRAMVPEAVLYVLFDVGEEIAMEGACVSGGL